MGAALRRGSSRLVGWLADRRIPRPLRAPILGGYARLFDVDLSEVRLPLAEHPSLAAFFVRRLKAGARSFPADPAVLPSPADGRVQAAGRIERDALLQAKGHSYSVTELLAGAARDVQLEGGWAWTIYLSPRDYHRVHAPVDARLVDVRWVPGGRLPVKPSVLERRDRVFATNERAVLRLETERAPLFLVMVGALNVSRIRVVGVAPGEGAPAGGRAFARGDELARFELGSTVILIAPAGGPEPARGEATRVGKAVRMGDALGAWRSTVRT